MTLASGTKLGPYEILSPLGAGGMGEVYRARDTRLDREVAVKVLPAEFSQDGERRARFETEARAVAALSHPNVLAIHDLGAQGEVVYAVMELVEGDTLRTRLVDGPLSVSRAIALSAQIARGLAAAHDRGILHRDLKPDNIMITPEGQAKILDFGLAKRVTEAADGSHSLAPTLAAMTEPGALLGTHGYMAPEQVRGLAADARSDLFALGAVIHEMISGRRAFQGESPADTMTAILREDPAELAGLVPEVPASLARIVGRCLEKNPAARFRSAADLAFALEAIATSSSVSAKAPAAAARSVPRFCRLTYRAGWVSGAQFVPGGVDVVFSASWQGQPYEIFSARPGSPEARSLGLPSATLLSLSSSGEMALSLGYRHHYWNVVMGTLARVPLTGGGVRPLQKDVGDACWSPDGTSMALVRYVEGRCRLESPPGKVLLETRDWLSCPSLSRDGTKLAFVHHHLAGDSGGEVCVMEVSGGEPTRLQEMTTASGIAWSPDGSEIWCSGIDLEQQNRILALRPDGGKRELFTSAARVGLHDVAADGRVLLSLGSARHGLIVGSEEGSRERDLSWFDGSLTTDFTPDGSKLLFFEAHEAENPHYACFLRDLDGSPAIRLGDGYSTAISPDGQWVLAVLMRPKRGLFLYPTGFGEPREVPTPGIELVHSASFHPDGRRLVVVGRGTDSAHRAYFVSLDDGRVELLWDQEIRSSIFGVPVSPDGDGVVLRLPTGEIGVYSAGSAKFTPIPALGRDDLVIRYDTGGSSLLVAASEGESTSIQRVDLGTGERTLWRTLMPPDPTGMVYIGNPIVSSDGRSYAYSQFRKLADLYVVENLG